ncbi:hypothetical protein C8J55DRAFT_483953 [Lentinula edodes]|uniref:Uncharacterized protein n=1 Tax=Lentinula lateritia TaxID=40482 RepID=A0A9W9E2X2_9AGAR|nr:hypothetical protein C8J55DRAFT_483953 [Lentinula edodes]
MSAALLEATRLSTGDTDIGEVGTEGLGAMAMAISLEASPRAGSSFKRVRRFGNHKKQRPEQMFYQWGDEYPAEVIREGTRGYKLTDTYNHKSFCHFPFRTTGIVANREPGGKMREKRRATEHRGEHTAELVFFSLLGSLKSAITGVLQGRRIISLEVYGNRKL